MDKFIVGLLYKDGLLTLPAAIVQDDLGVYRMMPFQGTPTQEVRDDIISFFKDTSSNSLYFNSWSSHAGGGTYKSATLQNEIPYFWMEAKNQCHLLIPNGTLVEDIGAIFKEAHVANSMICRKPCDPYRDICGFTYIHDGKLGEAVADKNHNYLGFGEELPDEVIDNLDEPEKHDWRSIVGYHMVSGRGHFKGEEYVWSLVSADRLLVCVKAGFSGEEMTELRAIIEGEIERVYSEN